MLGCSSLLTTNVKCVLGAIEGGAEKFTYVAVVQEEKALAHLYEHIEYPYPGDKDAVENFLETGGSRGANLKTRLSTRVDDKSGQLQKEKVEREAAKLWQRMKREAVRELQEVGYTEAKR